VIARGDVDLLLLLALGFALVGVLNVAVTWLNADGVCRRAVDELGAHGKIDQRAVGVVRHEVDAPS